MSDHDGLELVITIVWNAHRYQRMQQRERAASRARHRSAGPDPARHRRRTALSSANFLEIQVREAFGVKVLAMGERNSIIAEAVQQVGEDYGLAILPTLTRPLPPTRSESARRCCCPTSQSRARQCMSSRSCMGAGSSSGISRKSMRAAGSPGRRGNGAKCGTRPRARCRQPISLSEWHDPYFLRLVRARDRGCPAALAIIS